MRKRYKIFLIIIIILLILLSGITVYMQYYRTNNNDATNKSSVIHKIDEFGYTLDDRDTKLMQEEFYALEDIIDSSEIDYQEYAKRLSKLFIIDLYTIENKINKYDIGSLEYLFESEKEKFKNIIIDSIYENVLDNSYHKREQELPEVKSITVNNILEETYQKGDDSVDSYVVSLSWDYIKDLGYDNEALVTLIKEDDKLYVVEYNPVVNNVEGDV